MNDIVLSIKNLTAGYGGKAVVSQASFGLDRGEIIVVVGESGSGKSTLLKAILPLEDYGVAMSGGEIIFKNKPLSGMTAAEKNRLNGRQIGMVFQDPKASFNPVRTFRKQFIEALKSHGRYERELFEEQVLELFRKLKLLDGERILDSCPYEMSGGMNQRIAIALAILLEPVLLLADEPTSALDVTAQEQVMEELLRIREYYHTSMIIVTHNIGVAARLADKVGVMHRGKIVEFGAAGEVLEHPRNSYTKRLLDAVPQAGNMAEKREIKAACYLLELKQVGKSYLKRRNSFSALSQVDLLLKPGEILGIVGESGSGKSTLLKQVAGLKKPSEGRIVLHGKDITQKRTNMDFRRMQMIFQNAYDSFNPKLKIRHSIAETLKNLGGMKDRKEVDARIDSLMERVGLEPYLADRYPAELSGGQCQRAAIARAISVNPEVLLCDEITSALDVSVQADIVKLIVELANESGMAIIFVSHDIVLVSNICGSIMVMREGRCIEAGEAKEVITNPKEDYTKRLLASARAE
ncbi:MAG TPA: ABC transporter ATP-binding protein [Clostridiales bacterium]|nr:ABC transporter ATP-binding protein [Clostridiales bacterium]